MPRIAFTSTMTKNPWGGSELLWSQVAARFAHEGIEVHAHVRRWTSTPEPVRELERAGVRFHWLYKRRPAPRLVSDLGLLVTTGVWPPHHGWLRRADPDLVVISTGIHTEGVDIAASCRRLGLPYALVVQSAGESFWLSDGPGHDLAEMYLGAAAVFFMAAENRKLVERQLAVRLPDSKVVWNPFNVDWDASPEWPGDDGTLRLACIGRLEPSSKGQDVLFEVLAQEKWRARDVRVSLYGEGTSERLLRRLAELDELESVSFEGHESDVAGIWAEHHALVLPARYEGTPLVVVEAMLCGRACIVTSAAGRDLVVDGETGFVAPACTRELVEGVLERAWQRRSELRAMGARASAAIRARVPKDPSAVFAGDLRELLTQVAAR